MYASAIDMLNRHIEELEMEANLWDNENKPDNADLSRKVADEFKSAIEVLRAA